MADLLFKDPPKTANLLFGDAGDDAPAASNAVNLVFDRLAATSTPNLVFGDDGGTVIVPSVTLSVSATLPALTVSAVADYKTDTQRPTVGTVGSAWQVASPLAASANPTHQDTKPLPAGVQADHQQAQPLSVPIAHLLPDVLAPLHSQHTAQHQDAQPFGLMVGFWHQNGIPFATHARTCHQDAVPLRGGARVQTQHGIYTPASRCTHWQQAQRQTTWRHARHQVAKPQRIGWQAKNKEGMPPPPGRSVAPIPPTPSTYTSTAHLVFCASFTSRSKNLVFGLSVCEGTDTPTWPDAPTYIRPARFYMSVHNLTCHLLPSNTEIPIFGCDLSADVGSFCWSFSATGPYDLFDALAPISGIPQSVRITLDGLEWVFAIDQIARDGAFGKRTTRISGRSVTSLIAAPYMRETALTNASDQTAQQLALSALDLTGVGLDWGIEDWLLPANTYAQIATPLAAVQAIAEAAGGYINSHRSAPTLLVRHPYPTLPGGITGGPWNWGGAFAADVELSTDALVTTQITRTDGPNIDGVYVSGTTSGVLAHVKRTGTLGELLAPIVVDPLVTAVEAASQRGLSVIGRGGSKHNVSITIPVMTGASQPGVLDVGDLVQVNDSTPWRARVRSVSVSASMPKVRQSLVLERHL